MPHPATTAAPPPVTPRTLRNRRRFIPSTMSSPLIILVVTHRAVPRHLLLHVTADAPAHPERLHLRDLSRVRDVTVTKRAGVIPESLDVAHMREVHEPGQGVHTDPLGRLLVAPGLPDLRDLGLMGRRRTADELMAPHAGLQRRNPRLGGDFHRVMAVHAGEIGRAHV